MTYVISAVGIPVYLHYCGGELEKVNYVIKSDSCCGGEEDDSMAGDNGCCKDENLVIQNSTDFTFKNAQSYDLVKTFCDLFYIDLPFSAELPAIATLQKNNLGDQPPPPLQHSVLISTSVLRI